MKTEAGDRAGSEGLGFRPTAFQRNGHDPDVSLGSEGHDAGGQMTEARAESSGSTGSLAALLAEAQAAVSASANTLRDVRERYRAAYLEQVEHWQALRAAVAASSSAAESGGVTSAAGGGGASADTLRRDEAVASQEVGAERSALARVELAVKSLENAWLFLAREDNSLVGDMTSPTSPVDLQMRIVEAQEAERSRLAREVHDGPAQALSNAIFQVEVVQRLLDRDEAAARAELSGLREVLTRELRGVRAYLSQLRPPLLADLGLGGAIHEAAQQTESALGVPVTVDLDEGVDGLPETVEIVILRVIQEALQNARKHAAPTGIRVRVESETDGGWTVEVRDDGRGFDADGRTDGPRRNFGLHFMRERAELIGARFDVRSGQALGTVVRMSIPPGAMGMPTPGEVRE
ncbi:MAG: sensor histidine kinase [Chloroflexi bacterium]|nr:sensor histidine kinase [Chloroflexota bacterium]